MPSESGRTPVLRAFPQAFDNALPNDFATLPNPLRIDLIVFSEDEIFFADFEEPSRLALYSFREEIFF